MSQHEIILPFIGSFMKLLHDIYRGFFEAL